MHSSLPTWLVLAAAGLIPTASAFYPYQREDSSTSPPPVVRTRRFSPHADLDGRSLTLPIRRVIRPRQNTYPIVNSKDPKQGKSVAVAQDGNDLSYMVAVTFGTSKEKYYMLLDSAASNTWVMAQDCASEACKTHNALGTGDSSSLKPDTKPFNVTYGTGSISGTLVSDTLHIGSLSAPLTFGLATTVSEEFNSYPMDGILGIGRGIKNGGSVGAPQMMDALISSKVISSKLYGIHMNRNKDGTLDGEMNFGEVNKDRFSGDINWSSAIDNDAGFWEINIADAVVDGKAVGLTGRTAIIDTGTSYILMPQSDAAALHGKISGFKQDGENFSVPCDSHASLQFTFNKVTYDISAADWKGAKLDSGLCASNIIGRKTFGDKQWLVGDVFLKNVYSVYDFDNKRVGFGVKSSSTNSANANTASSTSGSSTSASAPGGSANPTPAAQSQPQGQKSGNVAVGRPSPMPYLYTAFLVFFTAWIILFM